MRRLCWDSILTERTHTLSEIPDCGRDSLRIRNCPQHRGKISCEEIRFCMSCSTVRCDSSPSSLGIILAPLFPLIFYRRDAKGAGMGGKYKRAQYSVSHPPHH